MRTFARCLFQITGNFKWAGYQVATMQQTCVDDVLMDYYAVKDTAAVISMTSQAVIDIKRYKCEPYDCNRHGRCIDGSCFCNEGTIYYDLHDTYMYMSYEMHKRLQQIGESSSSIYRLLYGLFLWLAVRRSGTKCSRLPNLHTIITSSLFNVLVVLALHPSLLFLGNLHHPLWKLLIAPFGICFTMSLESTPFIQYNTISNLYSATIQLLQER